LLLDLALQFANNSLVASKADLIDNVVPLSGECDKSCLLARIRGTTTAGYEVTQFLPTLTNERAVLRVTSAIANRRS
jgi:hypothetical protein